MKNLVDLPKPQLQEEILVSNEIFIKIVKFISLQPHETSETAIWESANFPFTHYVFLGLMSISYNFRDPNIVSNTWKPSITVHRRDVNYGNEKIPDLDLNELTSKSCSFMIYDGKVVPRYGYDSSIDCKDTICVYNELLEMINR